MSIGTIQMPDRKSISEPWPRVSDKLQISSHSSQRLSTFFIARLTNWDQQDGPVVTFQRAIYSGLLNLTNDGGYYRGSAVLWEKKIRKNYHSKGRTALTTHKY